MLELAESFSDFGFVLEELFSFLDLVWDWDWVGASLTGAAIEVVEP
jgi:hypothetical protein